MLLTSISFIVGMDKRLWNSQLKACNLKYGIMATKQKSQISHAQNIQHTCNIKLHKVLLSTQM